MRSRLLSARVAAPLLLAAVVGCSSSSDTVTGTTPTSANFRIVQAINDAPTGVDFALNNSLAIIGLSFGFYVPATQGQYADIQLGTQLGFAADGATTAFYNQVPSGIVADGKYTLVTYGNVTATAGSTPTPPAAVAVLSDTAGRPATGALVRVFNALDYVRTAATGTPVDLYVYADGSARPATPDVAGLAFGARTAYLVKAAGTLRVDVFAAGAATTGTPLFSGLASAGTGAVRTLVLLDPPAGAASVATGSILVLNDVN